ncbi:trypsin alpha-4-like [Melitaea cinxia]|uniref:trypsin alpha-4-like n=1 Tax=Melitaea cinxia TaxID=113334 RepID=UPI001E2746C9|nr:trypsin alpha-4-like [Melitaea cinxia]
MFTKLTITFVILLQSIEGYPSVPGHKPYNINNILSPRIVGGQDAPEGYAKHMAALVVGNQVTMLTCGASIINRRHMLTAAHCIQPYVIWGELSPHLKGVIGSNYWNSTNIVKFSGHKIHPKYGWTNLANDIGVLRTAVEIVYSDLVSAIAMKYDFVGGGVKGFVTGWGQLKFVQKKSQTYKFSATCGYSRRNIVSRCSTFLWTEVKLSVLV